MEIKLDIVNLKNALPKFAKVKPTWNRSMLMITIFNWPIWPVQFQPRSNQNQHSYRTWNSSSFTKDFFFLNFCNFPKTSSIIYFQFYFLEWKTQAIVLVNYWSFWNMKGFLIFGQFLVILIGLSVYAPLYRVRRNPENRFLIPGLETIRKSDEIGAVERIKYEIAHFNELFYFLVIVIRIILAKGMVFRVFRFYDGLKLILWPRKVWNNHSKVIQSVIPLSTRFYKSLQTREVERLLAPMPSMGPKSRITGQSAEPRYNTRSRSRKNESLEAKKKFLDQLNLRPSDDSSINDEDSACHQNATNEKTLLNISLKQFYPLSIVNRKFR